MEIPLTTPPSVENSSRVLFQFFSIIPGKKLQLESFELFIYANPMGDQIFTLTTHFFISQLPGSVSLSQKHLSMFVPSAAYLPSYSS